MAVQEKGSSRRRAERLMMTIIMMESVHWDWGCCPDHDVYV